MWWGWGGGRGGEGGGGGGGVNKRFLTSTFAAKLRIGCIDRQGFGIGRESELFYAAVVPLRGSSFSAKMHTHAHTHIPSNVLKLLPH